MDVLNVILAFFAVVFSGLAVYLTRKYHKISMSHIKSKNLQDFIDLSVVLLSEYEIIKKSIDKSNELGSKYNLDKREEVIIEESLKKMRALGKSISLSAIFSEKVHRYVLEIYSLMRGVVSCPTNLETLSEKIKELQDVYDSGAAIK